MSTGDVTYEAGGDGAQTAQPRASALLAGFGTAGSLVGATAIAATIVGGVIAFSTWPGAPGNGDQPQVQLLTDGPVAIARVLSASATATAVADAGAAAAAAAGDGLQRGGPGVAATTRGTGSGVIPASVVGMHRGGRSDDGLAVDRGGARDDRTLDDVADMTRETGIDIGGSVGSGSADVAEELSLLAPRTAEVLRRTGAATDEAVRTTSDTVADVLRVLPQR